MLADAELTLRDLIVDDYPAARRMLAAAFAGEPFAFGMFGASPLARFAGMAEVYSSWPSATNGVVVGAEVGGSLVGVALATLPGECVLCDQFAASAEPGTSTAQRVEYELQLRCRDAHLSQALPPHAHITAVASEPFLNGVGVGRRVVTGLVERLWSFGVSCAVLECLTTREQFYERCGLRRVADFPDPGGPDLRSVLMRIDAPTR